MLPTVCACSKLRRSARVATALYDEALAPAGLSVTQFSLLRMLVRAGPSSLTSFAEATGYDRTTLNRTLGPLQKMGLIQSRGGKDQRTRIISLTENGKAAIRRAEPHWEEAQQRIAAKLGSDQAALFALLDKVEGLRA
jgi:DNA-binding MarR family transcriptional regulator